MKKLLKLFQALALLVFCFGVLGSPSGFTNRTAGRVHPMLARLAAEQPEQRVSVIVMVAEAYQAGAYPKVEALIKKLGGRVTDNLRIIHALAAELSAGATLELAKSPEINWITLNAAISGAKKGDPPGRSDIAGSQSQYLKMINVQSLWVEKPTPIQGQGITVAVVDSGIDDHPDFYQNGVSRVLASVSFASSSPGIEDGYGHGTHIAGIIGGNGSASLGSIMGVAPQVNLINVKVADDLGQALTSDLIAGLEWIYENKDIYKIRVVNLSMSSSVPESYHSSPLDAALEVLWFNGVVVVVSAGNNGSDGTIYPPANDPFVITVGVGDDNGTPIVKDDVMPAFSAAGSTLEGFTKPDLLAPGENITAVMAGTDEQLAKDHPENIVTSEYFRMSGTSMASAVTAGATALLLQAEPGLNPDQVKARLITTARPFGPQSRPGMLDISRAVRYDTLEIANSGVITSQLLWTGNDPLDWGSVNWSTVNWSTDYWDE